MKSRTPVSWSASLCATLLTIGCVPSQYAPSLGQVVFRNRLATVGLTDATVNSLEVDLTIQEGESTDDAVYTVTRDGRMRIDIMHRGERVYTEAFDGRDGWDLGKSGTLPVTDAFAKALWHGTQFPGNIFDVADMPTNGHRIELMGSEIMGAARYYVLRLTLSDGFQTYRYINAANWLIERGRDFRAFHPGTGGKQSWIETVWSDYRMIQGRKYAFLSVSSDLATGRWIATNTVTAIKVNPPIDAAMFIRPTY